MAEAKGKGPSRIWRIVLVLSLALNLAVVGLVVGVGLRAAGGKPPRSVEFGFGVIGQALTQEQRREIGRSLRADPSVRRAGRPNRVMVEALIEVLRAPVVDEAQLTAALDGASRRAETLQTAARTAFVAQVLAMSDAERLALAERLEGLSKRRDR